MTRARIDCASRSSEVREREGVFGPIAEVFLAFPDNPRIAILVITSYLVKKSSFEQQN